MGDLPLYFVILQFFNSKPDLFFNSQIKMCVFIELKKVKQGRKQVLSASFFPIFWLMFVSTA